MMDKKGPAITITPLKPSELPSEETILAEGRELIQSSSTWAHGKTYFHNVKTFHSPKRPTDGAPWHGRHSEHTSEEITFDVLWEKLSKDKPITEKEYIHEIHKVAKVKEISPNAIIWTMYYTFTPPIAARVFTVLQITHLEESKPRTGIVVSIPVDLSSKEDQDLAKAEEKGVRGRYTSVERVMELENGNTEWSMITSSTPGGSLPNFIVESTLPKKIASDVPQFMKWLHSQPKEHS